MKILAIETSCDETAISIVEASGDFDNLKFDVLSDVVLSQIDLHREYGGVFPALAKREHSKNLIPVLGKSLKDSEDFKEGRFEISEKTREKLEEILEREPELLKQFLDFIPKINVPNIDVIAVTQGPGLEPTLWVGLNFAKALSLVWKKPLVPVNHMEGHIFASLLEKNKINFPALSLLISGGHTELVLIKDWLEYEKIGQTQDDAVGECFDKVARVLGLPYPGGPEISKIACNGELNKGYNLPRPMINSGNFNFSFSGLKTAVLYMVKKLGEINEKTKANIAREFEQAVVDVLMKKTFSAVEEYGIRTLILGGGVTANKRIREEFTKKAEQYPELDLSIPSIKLSTDNAVMIALAGYLHTTKKEFAQDLDELKADGNLSF